MVAPATPAVVPAATIPTLAAPAQVAAAGPVAAASQADADSALLAQLAKSQEVGRATLQVAAAQAFALPARPLLSEVPDLLLPGNFCSAEQRNAFYGTRYKPALELARAQQEVAAMTYSRQASLVRKFDTIMAVPISACQVVAAR